MGGHPPAETEATAKYRTHTNGRGGSATVELIGGNKGAWRRKRPRCGQHNLRTGAAMTPRPTAVRRSCLRCCLPLRLSHVPQAVAGTLRGARAKQEPRRQEMKFVALSRMSQKWTFSCLFDVLAVCMRPALLPLGTGKSPRLIRDSRIVDF